MVRYKSFKEKKIEYLTLVNVELEMVIRKLLVIYPIETWPDDNDHNLIKGSITDLKLLTIPQKPVFEHECSRCGCEITKTQATGRIPRCKSCYSKWKREQRQKLGRD